MTWNDFNYNFIPSIAISCIITVWCFESELHLYLNMYLSVCYNNSISYNSPLIIIDNLIDNITGPLNTYTVHLCTLKQPIMVSCGDIRYIFYRMWASLSYSIHSTMTVRKEFPRK